MKKVSRLVLLFVFTIALFSATSCYVTRGVDDLPGSDGTNMESVQGNGIVSTQTRNVEGTFENIEVSSGIDLVVSQNENHSIEVKTDENIQSLIATKVQNGVLMVTRSSAFRTSKNPEVRVSLPLISSLKSTSGATIKSANTFKSELLTLSSTSGSTIKISVNANTVRMESTSGSDLHVSGTANKAVTSATSGSTIDARNLIVEAVDAQATSGSSTTIHPVQHLRAKATSGATIKYTNVPKSIDKQENSGGSVKRD